MCRLQRNGIADNFTDVLLADALAFFVAQQVSHAKWFLDGWNGASIQVSCLPWADARDWFSLRQPHIEIHKALKLRKGNGEVVADVFTACGVDTGIADEGFRSDEVSRAVR